MEEEIVHRIISETNSKLEGTNTNLNMLDILQTYDQYIKKEKLGIDLKTKVYKNLLKWSRENLLDNSPSDSGLTESEGENTLQRTNSDLEYDFREENLSEGHREAIKNSNRSQGSKKMTLPKLWLDEIIEPQLPQSVTNKNDPYTNNKNKPPIARKTKHSFVMKSSEKPLKEHSDDQTRNTGQKLSTFESFEHNSGIFTPNFRNRGDYIGLSPQIVDLFDKIDKHTAINSNDTIESHKERRNRSNEPMNRQRFSELMNSYDSEVYMDADRQKYILDAHLQVAQDYNERQLLSKAWRSLLVNKIATMQENLVCKIGSSHYKRNLLNRSFNAIFQNSLEEKVTRTENYKSDQYFRLKTLRKFMREWRMATWEIISENQAVEHAKQKLDYKKKLAVMLKWKEWMLHTQVRRAQNYTAVYVYKKALYKKGFTALKLHQDHEKRQRLRYNQAVQFETVKLLTTAFKILQWYRTKKKANYELNLRIEAAYNHLAVKRGFKLFRRNIMMMKEQKKVTHWARNFYNTKLLEKYFNIFRNYTLIKVGIKNQHYCIINYYKERLVLKTFNALKKYIADKKEYRINALVFKHRGWQRKLIYSWKYVASTMIVRQQPEHPVFYHAAYVWIQTVFSKDEITDQTTFWSNRELPMRYFPNYFEVSNKPKYNNFHKEANKKVSNYLLDRIFIEWKRHTQQIKNLRARQKDRVLKDVMREWHSYSNFKMIQNLKIRRFQDKYNYIKLSMTFFRLKYYLQKKINLKKRMNEFKSYAVTKLLRQSDGFMNSNYPEEKLYEFILVKQTQDLNYCTTIKAYATFFMTWRQKHLKYIQLTFEDQKLETYQKYDLLKKVWNSLKQYTI